MKKTVAKPKLAAPKPAPAPPKPEPAPVRGAVAGRAPSKSKVWGIKRPDGTLVPVADPDQAVVLEAAEHADAKIAALTGELDVDDSISALRKKGYTVVEVVVVEK